MDSRKLPHVRTPNKQQEQSSIIKGKMTTSVNAEPRSNLPSKVHGFDRNSTSGSARSDNRSDNLPSNVRGPTVVKSTANAWNEYAGQASSSKASSVRRHPAPQSNLQEMPPPHLRGKLAAAAQPSKPTPPMNVEKLARSVKYDSKVPCTYEDCTRGFTKEADMRKHKDQVHEWCRLCNVDCADDEALLEHKVQSEAHICCDVCGEDFRSEMGKERHMRQVRL